MNGVLRYTPGQMDQFSAILEIIVGNPYVLLPEAILNRIFQQANKNKGGIPIRGTINGKPFQQTLVKFSGEWRLYVNMKMLKDSPRRIGEVVEVEVEFDPSDRTIIPHPKFLKGLAENAEANRVFNGLSASRQKEIIRYIANLKTEASVDRNVTRAIDFLLGKGRFVGRDRP